MFLEDFLSFLLALWAYVMCDMRRRENRDQNFFMLNAQWLLCFMTMSKLPSDLKITEFYCFQFSVNYRYWKLFGFVASIEKNYSFDFWPAATLKVASLHMWKMFSAFVCSLIFSLKHKSMRWKQRKMELENFQFVPLIALIWSLQFEKKFFLCNFNFFYLFLLSTFDKFVEIVQLLVLSSVCATYKLHENWEQNDILRLRIEISVQQTIFHPQLTKSMADDRRHVIVSNTHTSYGYK